MKQKAFYEKSLQIELTPIGFREERIGHRATVGAYGLNQRLLKAEVRQESVRAVYKEQAQSGPEAPSFDEILYEAKIVVEFKLDPSTD